MNYKDFFKENWSNKSDKNLKGVSRQELAEGIKFEKRYVESNKLALKIALSHLKEDSQYYSKLKQAGLQENDMMGLTSPLALFPDKGNSKGICEPDTKRIDKQTTPGTVFPKVEEDPSKGPDMAGSIGSTHLGSSGVEYQTDVSGVPKDPTPTDHVTGQMGHSPSNPNILPKAGALGGGSVSMVPMAQDISIDIAEGKKLLGKLMEDAVNNSTVKGTATAFAKEGFVPAAGDPDKDDHFVKGKRWTVSYDKKTPQMENKQFDATSCSHCGGLKSDVCPHCKKKRTDNLDKIKFNLPPKK